MNPSDFDHPDLTAYALGELGERDATRVRHLLARSPQARQEFERIQQAVSALKQPQAVNRPTLSARQRETVLAMAQAPMPSTRGPGKVIPFARPAKQSPSFLWRLTKLAAAACVTAGVFFVGQKSAGRAPAIAKVDSPSQGGSRDTFPSAAPLVAPDSSLANDLLMKNFEAVMQGTPVFPSAVIPTLMETPAPAVAPVTPPVMVAQKPASPAPLPAPASPSAPATVLVAASPSTSHAGFTETSAAAEAVIAFHPKLVKPEPVVFAGIVLASKAPVDRKPANSPQARPGRPEAQPPLVIHSWKAEVASCPWDASRRLMRFVAQIPVDQDAMDAEDAEYKLVAKFDPAQVQAYRLVTEKHMPPSSGGTQATRFAWYEIIPSKNFHASHDRPVAIGTVEVVQPRGSSSRDANATTLKLLDRGQNWSDAREDFVFETAMVGFNQLLQGTVNTSGLNHKVVLDLAEKTKGEDATGERGKFIQTVKQAQRAAGL